MGEKAVLQVQAHVFQIDPETKKKWLPTSTSSVRVAYYHDPSRKTYRIIALEGGKPLVNSTVTANMAFTKTSPKFGQWSDHRANTVYGLGFSSESDLSLFSDKFSEAKSAARVLLEERKRQKVSNTATTDTSINNEAKDELSTSSTTTPTDNEPVSPDTTPSPVAMATSLPSSNGGSSNAEQHTSTETDKQSNQQVESLKYENNKLKVALASSAQNVKKWESEMQTLRNNNAMLTTALEESTQHVAEWKRQLQKYKEECDSLRKKVSEMETSSKDQSEIEAVKHENEELKEVLSAVQVDLESKTEECDKNANLILQLNDKLKMIESENQSLASKVEEQQTTLKAQEGSRREKSTQLQKKSQEIESQITALLTLQKDFSKQLTV